jgi:Na+-driven multidrug efflux pump
MFSCLYSLYNQVVVLNLISSQGYVFHFLEQFFTLVVLSLLGHGGRGALAAGCIGLSLCFLFINLLTGFQQTVPHFLRKEKHHKTWLIAALFLNLVVCILYLATILLLSLVLFPFLPLKNSVLRRAVWFAILLSPYLFVTGVRSLCIQHHDFMNRTRPIIVASMISSTSAFVGTWIYHIHLFIRSDLSFCMYRYNGSGVLLSNGVDRMRNLNEYITSAFGYVSSRFHWQGLAV